MKNGGKTRNNKKTLHFTHF